MVDGYMLNKVLDGIKEVIGIEKFVNTKILIDTDDKLINMHCMLNKLKQHKAVDPN